MLTKQAKMLGNQDVELICTGSTFKWMSLSVYQQTGEILFVEAPENAPSGFEHIKCSYSYLNDAQTDKFVLSHISLLPVLNYSQAKVNIINALHIGRKHQLALSRAPPFLS